MNKRSQDSFERVTSGVAGLDTVLRGGFLRGGLYIVQGSPGAGKTILGNQICFEQINAGKRALYVTLLAESHARMLQHLGSMSFFDVAKIPDSITYVSGFRVLEEAGLKGLIGLIRREIQAHDITVLVIDGVVAAREMAPSTFEFKKFIHELQTLAGVSDCTMFLLTSVQGTVVTTEHTMVDGLIELNSDFEGDQAVRHLTVSKFRGSAALHGRHSFRITSDGIVLYPRIEGLYANPRQEDPSPPRLVALGIDALDTMVGGGVTSGTTTMLLGPPGSGKTTMGMHFLAGSTGDAPGLFFGFYETPPRLLLKAHSLGIDLAGLVERDAVEIVWQAATHVALDEFGHRVLTAVEKRGATRLFLDGLHGFSAAVERDRTSQFFAALTNELRLRGVTTVFTMEAPGLVGLEIHQPLRGVSAIAENIIVLRLAEHQARLRRLLSIIKIRDRGFDDRVRGFVITDHGIEVLDRFAATGGSLYGSDEVDDQASPRSANSGKGDIEGSS